MFIRIITLHHRFKKYLNAESVNLWLIDLFVLYKLLLSDRLRGRGSIILFCAINI